MRGCTDGDGQFNGLAICVRYTRVCRDVLVVDIHRTGDIPVVGRYAICFLVSVADVIAVVDDGLRAVDEVTRGLPFMSESIGIFIAVVPLGGSTLVQCRQRGRHVVGRAGLTMLVLSIDETATDTGLHIDEVKLYDTRDGAPVLLIESITSAQLRGQLQIDT